MNNISDADSITTPDRFDLLEKLLKANHAHSNIFDNSALILILQSLQKISRRLPIHVRKSLKQTFKSLSLDLLTQVDLWQI